MNNKLLPYITLNSLTVFPGITTILDVDRKQSIEANLAFDNSPKQALFLINDPGSTREDDPKVSDFYKYCMVGRVNSLNNLANGGIRLTIEGMQRARLLGFDGVLAEYADDYMDLIPDEDTEDPEEIRNLREDLETTLSYMVENLNKNATSNAISALLNKSDVETGTMMNAVIARVPFNPEQRYGFITRTGFTERLKYLVDTLMNDISHIKVKANIREKVKLKIDKNQRDYVLREEMKTIQDELGEGQAAQNQELRDRAAALDAPEEVITRVNKEIARLEQMPFGGQEGVVLRNYIEAVLDMPWNRVTEENNDIAHAEEILEEDHYGLEKVKNRVLEYLAVRNLNGGNESTIMCLVGPPGTGKTSIAKSIARALGREYVRISLGGVHDEAEIRGHRKTYVGAMPGRIANAIKMAKVSNPVILLDELDKLSADHRGDPASALLEVLDSEQNVAFRDHFIELPIDLSRVIFIATANDPSTIPGPLRDRVEMIQVESYTANEKMHIARKYLVDKQIKKHGLTSDNLTITDDAIDAMIHLYTREAGVRELERKIGMICRKVARRMLESDVDSYRITKDELYDYLGKAIFKDEKPKLKDEVGIVRGLAWTSVGGDTLEVEVNVLNGHGDLTLTGKLGDVMKESAQTALSYVRSVGPEYNVDSEYFDKHDIHLHVPEGAVPKDGPSAGITIATAMLSAVTGKPVRGDVAMTGEVTLRGRVLPIGGLREKLLAANVAGMKRVLVPEANEPDVAEISQEIIGDMEIRFVSEMSQVLEGAML
ncbi:MAG: endopeptidase La [Lachnospiraceae bacterium]|nr:endopeptidase La [Lachnospiraceae bacterium]